MLCDAGSEDRREADDLTVRAALCPQSSVLLLAWVPPMEINMGKVKRGPASTKLHHSVDYTCLLLLGPIQRAREEGLGSGSL